jgi:hypothetical protein
MTLRMLHRPLEELPFVVDETARPPSGIDEEAVDAFWSKRLDAGDRIYDGSIVACFTSGASLGLRRGNYKTYAWARASGAPAPGAHAVGTCALVWAPEDDEIALVRRSQRIAFDKGALSGLGGVVEWSPRIHEGVASYFRQSMRDEIDEELTTPEPIGDDDTRYVGAYIDERTLKLELFFVIRTTSTVLRGWENDAMVRVRRAELPLLPRDAVETSLRNHLALFEVDPRRVFST